VSRLARAEWALALAATIVALVLHVRLFLGAGPLWRDEVNTVVVATQPTLAGVWNHLDGEAFPLLPFALVRLWSSLGLGATDRGLRGFGLVVGLSCLAVLWLVRGRRVLAPPLVCLTLFALNPVALRWGDSVRGYGLGALTILLAFTAMFAALQRPRPATVALAAIAAIAAVQALYQNSVLLFAIGVGGAVVELRRGRPRRAALALGIGAVGALSLLPYLGVMGRYREYGLVSTEGATPRHLASVIWRGLGADVGLGWPGQVLAASSVAAVAWALVASARRPPALRPRRALRSYGLVVLLVAISAHFAFLLYLGFPTMPWYSLSLVALMAACLEATLQSRSPAFRVGRLVVVGLLVLCVTPRAFAYLGLRQTNVDVAAAAVAARAEPEDFVVVSPWFLAVPFNRYYHGAAPWSPIPPLEDTSVHRLDLLGRALKADDPVGALVARVENTLRGGHRVYWVGLPPASIEGDPPRLPPLRGPVTGTVQGLYGANWTLQVAQAVRRHAAAMEPLAFDTQPAPQRYERVGAWVVTSLRPR
jgi:hypothetical protein